MMPILTRTYRIAGVLALLTGVAAGCGDPSERSGTPSAGDAAAVYEARRGPAVPYRVDGACPFECCTYGTWTAAAELTAYAAVGDTTAAFTIPSGTAFEADTGFVLVTQAGLVVVDQPTEVYRGFDDSRTVDAGDTLYVLDYVGEGTYNVWFADSTYQLPPPYSAAPPADAPPAYRRLREPAQAWWAHAVLADGRTGWLQMDDAARAAVRGNDACGPS